MCVLAPGMWQSRCVPWQSSVLLSYTATAITPWSVMWASPAGLACARCCIGLRDWHSHVMIGPLCPFTWSDQT